MDDIEEVSMSPTELFDTFFDAELSKMICKHMAGKQVMICYTTLCCIIGQSIGATSRNVAEIQHAMDMCGQIVANAAQATYEGQKDDEPAAGVSKLQ